MFLYYLYDMCSNRTTDRQRCERKTESDKSTSRILVEFFRPKPSTLHWVDFFHEQALRNRKPTRVRSDVNSSCPLRQLRLHIRVEVTSRVWTPLDSCRSRFIGHSTKTYPIFFGSQVECVYAPRLPQIMVHSSQHTAQYIFLEATLNE